MGARVPTPTGKFVEILHGRYQLQSTAEVTFKCQWRLTAVEKLPRAERPDPAFRPLYPVGGLLAMKLATHNRYHYVPVVRRPDYRWPQGRRFAVYLALATGARRKIAFVIDRPPTRGREPCRGA